VVIESGTDAALIVMERLAVCDCAGEEESLTFAVKVEVAAAVGVPVMTPVDEFSASPAGSVPDEMLQAYGVLPPAAARV
jgi:hypothetical protein